MRRIARGSTPTELTIEERRDGTYYHFKRSYLARPWAYVAQPREMVEEEIKGMDEREIDELSPGERRKIITTFAKIEVIKLEAFARAAFEDVAPHAPQDIWLDLHAALLSLVELLDYDRLIELMGCRQEFDARHARHAMIGEHQRDGPLVQHLEPRGRVCRG